jgi:hypothetical protein
MGSPLITSLSAQEGAYPNYKAGLETAPVSYLLETDRPLLVSSPSLTYQRPMGGHPSTGITSLVAQYQYKVTRYYRVREQDPEIGLDLLNRQGRRRRPRKNKPPAEARGLLLLVPTGFVIVPVELPIALPVVPVVMLHSILQRIQRRNCLMLQGRRRRPHKERTLTEVRALLMSDNCWWDIHWGHEASLLSLCLRLALGSPCAPRVERMAKRHATASRYKAEERGPLDTYITYLATKICSGVATSAVLLLNNLRRSVSSEATTFRTARNSGVEAFLSI